MTCQQARAFFQSGKHPGQFSRAERSAVYVHVGNCKACRDLLHQEADKATKFVHATLGPLVAKIAIDAGREAMKELTDQDKQDPEFMS